ncbi:armadillo-like helical domain-containing protein 2 [Ciona intestinalis]
MFNSFARRISRRIGNVLKFLSPEEVDDTLLDREKNLYKRDIIRAARSIEMYENDLISPSALADAISMIGYLAYTGGPPANKCAGTYIPKFAELLAKSEIKSELKFAVLKSLCTICMNHADHQNVCFKEGLLRIVNDIAANTTDALQMWAIYCLFSLVLDNIRSLQALKAMETSHIFEAVENNWSGFRHNYADMLLKLTGLKPVRLKKVEKTEQNNPYLKVESKKKRKTKENQHAVHESELPKISET